MNFESFNEVKITLPWHEFGRDKILHGVGSHPFHFLFPLDLFVEDSWTLFLDLLLIPEYYCESLLLLFQISLLFFLEFLLNFQELLSILGGLALGLVIRALQRLGGGWRYRVARLAAWRVWLVASLFEMVVVDSFKARAFVVILFQRRTCLCNLRAITCASHCQSLLETWRFRFFLSRITFGWWWSLFPRPKCGQFLHRVDLQNTRRANLWWLIRQPKTCTVFHHARSFANSTHLFRHASNVALFRCIAICIRDFTSLFLEIKNLGDVIHWKNSTFKNFLFHSKF